MLKIKTLLLIILLIASSSCVERIEKKGYIFDQSNLSSIKEGVTSKSRVVQIMGYPNWHQGFDQNSWIYHSEEVRHLLFFKPKIISRKILILNFDQENILSQIRHLSLKDENQNFTFTKKFTEIEGHGEDGFFKSIFSNIGQIRPQ